jgi:DNA-binding transcriptional LysR family regulator
MLDALLRLRSVTLAARELDMSQSALSTALSRLRLLFGDPLFIRGQRGLVPTSRALELAAPLAALLAGLRDDVMAPRGFDASTSERRFTLCLSDVGSYVLWPQIVSRVAQQAPQVALQLKVLGVPAIAAALDTSGADLAVGAYPGLPGTLLQRRLFEREYVALVRAQHPLAGGTLGWSEFADTPQAAVRQASGVQDQIDLQLSGHGLQRRQVLEMPSYLMLPPLLLASDHLAVLPGQLADAFNRHGHFGILALPMKLPATTIRMHWHPRDHQDPGNVWLRELLVSLFGAGHNA